MLKFSSLIAVPKPAISVLYPTKSPLSKTIVFTDWVFSASGLNLSKKGITVFLKGTVTLQPAIFCSFTSLIKFLIS